MELTPQQSNIRDLPDRSRVFLRGEAGTGKTTAAVARMEKMVSGGIPAESILILVPQRPLGRPYSIIGSNPSLPPGGRLPVLTLGGLARRLDELFWPLVDETAGFSHRELEPKFLTVETTQYYLSLIVDPLREQGFFDGIAIEPLRLYSQILDNLNKTAVVGFPLEEIAPRLRMAWNGNQSDARFFDQAQECAILFRKYCLEHSLLDFSLQIETFRKSLWPQVIVQEYLSQRYCHLIYDNAEEDYPVAHDIIREWIPSFDSVLIIQDESAGYRSFLGADPVSAATISDLMERTIRFEDVLRVPEELRELKQILATNIRMERVSEKDTPIQLSGTELIYNRFYPQMLDSITNRIGSLVESGSQPGDIAVLSPFVSDSLRFSLDIRLQKKGIQLTTHRPGRELSVEPAVRCLFALAKLAYPQWNMKVNPLEFRTALMTAIDNMDLIRADLLAGTMLSRKKDGEPLNPFSQLNPEMAERITFQIGEKYETIRNWLNSARQVEQQGLPEFFSRCFGELLSQKGFGFHRVYDMADATDRLIESARAFISVITPFPGDQVLGAEFLRLMEAGITGAQHLHSWQDDRPDAVLLSPAFTFLMRNHSCKHQFWIDPGSVGWWERLNQPLTHPVVLSRNWPSGAKWTDAEELAHNQNTLVSHTTGLINRCTGSLYLYLVRVDEQGNEPRGPLLQAINRFLRHNPGGLKTYDA
ncbi:MAG: hypothetical protein GX577_09505 [Leptolinea sp.]|nr:hypothetical protein [Leptolinea sp.]